MTEAIATNRDESLYAWQWQSTALLMGLAIACGIVYRIDQMRQATIKELTIGSMGEQTDLWDQSVLCVDLIREQSQDCILRAERATGAKLLWLGNSQLPTINQMRPGDRTMVSILNESLLSRGTYVMGCAPPNANLQEHLLIAHYLFPRLKPSVLLLPVFYDDFRETGIREQLHIAFDSPETEQALNNSVIGRMLNDEHQSAARATTPTATASTSTLDWSEAKLNGWLEKRSHYWSERGTYRSIIFVEMFMLRNALFGIKADSIRRMIPERFELNMAALNDLFDLAQANEVKVLVYVPPIRNDVPIPYDMEAYNKFKLDLEKQVAELGFLFANLENEIPAEDWGTKESTGVGGGQEVDFMHFSAAGHTRLAGAIERLLIELKMVDKVSE